MENTLVRCDQTAETFSVSGWDAFYDELAMFSKRGAAVPFSSVASDAE